MAEIQNIKISTLVVNKLLQNPNAVMLATEGKMILNNINVSLTNELINDIKNKIAPGVNILGIASTDANVVTVTYNCNNGTLNGEEIYTQNVEVGSTITLPTPSRSGYTFNYWLDETDTLFDAGQTVEITTNKTFTAEWAVSGCAHTSTRTETRSASYYGTSYNCTTCGTGTKTICNSCGKTISGGYSTWGSHNWGTETHVAGYCGQSGYYEKKCTRNGCIGKTTRSDNTPGPHAYSSWVAQGDSHTRTCEICGGSQTQKHTMDAYNRSYQSTGLWAGTHKVTGPCITCGATFTTTESCTIEGSSCKYCGNHS